MKAKDAMQTMKACRNRCDEVPDEVSEAVFEVFDEIPGVDEEAREARASVIAERMAQEGWRFCPCFATQRTALHQRIFNLVHTNMANRLAHRLVLAQAKAQEEFSASALMCN